jgi:hypothetical protein
MRPKLQKQSALKLAGRIIPLTKLSGTDTINNTPKLALGFIHMDLSRSFCPGSCANRGGAPPTGVGGPKIYLRLKEPKDTYATSRSRRRIHPPTKSGAFCVVGNNIFIKNAPFTVPRWRGCHAVTGVDKALKTFSTFVM